MKLRIALEIPRRPVLRDVGKPFVSIDDVVSLINANTMLALFGIIALGTLLGSLRIRGMTLNSTGVLLVALLAGHFQVSLPDAVAKTGVVLFAYAVGLQAGPRFLRTFQRRGLAFVLITVTALITSMATCGLLAWLTGLPAPLASGLLCAP